MPNIYAISPLLLAIFLTACGQKGSLYLPKNPNQPLIQSSDNGTEAIPDQSTTPMQPSVLPSVQNPNVQPYQNSSPSSF